MTIKAAIKNLILQGPHRALQAVRPFQVIALQYHSIQEQPEQFSDTIGRGIIHSRELFRKQMEYVARNFAPISIDDLPRVLDNPNLSKRRAVIVTFDDGFRDNFETAAGILEEFGIPGVFYVATDAIEGPPLWFCRLRKLMWGKGNDEFRKYSAIMAASSPQERERTLTEICDLYSVQPPAPDLMMTWEQVRGLNRRGHVVGSHTVTHPNVAHVTPDDAEREIRESRVRLERELGVEVKHFSYPHPILFPCFNANTTEFCRRAGYTTAVTTTAGTIKKGDNPLALKRVSPPQDLDEFRWKLEYALIHA